MMPAEFRHGVFYWYAATLKRLRSTRFLLAGHQVDFSLIFEAGGNDAPQGIGLPGVLFDLARSGEFGDVDSTGRQNLYDVLIRLFQIMKQNEAAKKETPKR